MHGWFAQVATTRLPNSPELVAFRASALRGRFSAAGFTLSAQPTSERTPQAQSLVHTIRDRYGNMLSIWSDDNKEQETYDVDE